jgi:hypothetical protein
MQKKSDRVWRLNSDVGVGEVDCVSNTVSSARRKARRHEHSEEVLGVSLPSIIMMKKERRGRVWWQIYVCSKESWRLRRSSEAISTAPTFAVLLHLRPSAASQPAFLRGWPGRYMLASGMILVKYYRAIWYLSSRKIQEVWTWRIDELFVEGYAFIRIAFWQFLSRGLHALAFAPV